MNDKKEDLFHLMPELIMIFIIFTCNKSF